MPNSVPLWEKLVKKVTAMSQTTRQHRKPSLEALRALLAIHEEGSVTRAARKIGLTQPVVTRKLAVFDSAKACGAILLHRRANTLTLSEAGKDVMPMIRALVNQYDQLLHYLSGKSAEPSVVRLGVGSFVAQHYVPQALALLRRQRTDCAVETHIARGEERIRNVVRNTYDLAIVSHEPAQIREIARKESRSQALHIEPLVKLPMVVLARRDTNEGRELAQIPLGEFVRLEQLSRWELVGLDRNSGIRRQLERRLANPDELQFVSGGGWLAAKEFVRHGIGVAVVPGSIVSAADEKVFVTRPVSERLAVVYYLIHRTGKLTDEELAVTKALKAAAAA